MVSYFIYLSFTPPTTHLGLIQTGKIYGETVQPAETIGATPFLKKIVPISQTPTLNAVSSFLFLLVELKKSLEYLSYGEHTCNIETFVFSVFGKGKM